MRRPKTYSLKLTADEIAAIGATMALMGSMAKSEGIVPPMIIKIKYKTEYALEKINEERKKKIMENEVLSGI